MAICYKSSAVKIRFLVRIIPNYFLCTTLHLCVRDWFLHRSYSHCGLVFVWHTIHVTVSYQGDASPFCKWIVFFKSVENTGQTWVILQILYYCEILVGKVCCWLHCAVCIFGMEWSHVWMLHCQSVTILYVEIRVFKAGLGKYYVVPVGSVSQ